MKTVAKSAGVPLSLSNLEKELYPSFGFTKARTLEYYRRIAPFILPHLAGRALTLKRYPNGVAEPYFFEKRCPAHRPAWVETAVVPHHDGPELRACLVNDLNTLIWVANLASLELHVPQARTASPHLPDYAVFDLDPGDGAGLVDCARVALIIRELLAPLRIEGFVKGSGQKGLHLYIPLNRGEATYEEVKGFSKTVAELLQKNYPDSITAKMAKAERPGKVFINWSQNDASKTMVSVYSLRAREKPYVSLPLTWRALEEAIRRGDPGGLSVLAPEAQEKTAREGDLFAEVLTKKQRLP